MMKKSFSRMLLWILVSLPATTALLDIFSNPSSQEKAWLWGLSKQRFVIALIPSTCIIFCLSMIFLSLVAPAIYQKIDDRLRKIPVRFVLSSGWVSFWVSIYLSILLIVYRFSIAPYVNQLTPLWGNQLPTLSAYADRLWIVFFLVVCYSMSWVIYVIFVLKKPFFQDFGKLFAYGAGALCIFATGLQWIVFIFRLHLFEQIPGWYWPILIKGHFLRHAIIFCVLLVLFQAVIYLIRRFPRLYFVYLTLICVLFLVFMYAIGYMEGRGMASLTDRFFLSYHRIYIEEACNSATSARNAIIGYEDFSFSWFLQTKPPGVLWSSFLVKGIANLQAISPVLDTWSESLALSEFIPKMQDVACVRSMALVTFLFPGLAALVIGAMYWFAKVLIGIKESGQVAAYAAILFVLSPNVLMLPLFLDQAIYPTIFLFVIGVTILAIRKKSLAGSLLVGILLYSAAFLSFSMLPLFLIPPLVFFFILWQENRLHDIWQEFKRSLLPMVTGGILSLGLFKYFLNYDIFTRYQRMMNTSVEGVFYDKLGILSGVEISFWDKVRQTGLAMGLNNIELAVAIGFPTFIMFCVMGIRSLIHVIKRNSDSTAVVYASLFLTYVALIAFRVVLGEVARLWIFWVPPMALMAVQFLLPKIQRHWWFMPAWVALQMTTVFLTYQFQDYLMPQLLP